MGWSSSAPTLPSGSSWSEVGTWSRTANPYSTTGKVSMARLAEDQIAFKFELNTGNGSTSTFAPPSYSDFAVGSSVTTPGWGSRITITRYWTGTLAKDASVTVKAGAHTTGGAAFSHATFLSKSANGPAYVTKYTIRYYGNGPGGAAVTNVPATGTKTYGVTYNIPSTTPQCSGYAFRCWNDAADGGGPHDVYPGGTLVGNYDRSWYAQWAPNTYAVTYDANGGTGTTEAQTKTYGTDLTLRENGFTREHYVFVEWNTAADGSGTGYAEGGTYTLDAAVTLYAIWTPISYPIGYDGNGAESGATEPQKKTYDVPLVLRENGFVRQGYVFSGWNTSAEGTGTSYAAGGTYTVNFPTRLYAQWVKTNIPVFVDVGGAVYQVDKAYANVGGVIKECDVYVNINGTVVQIV